MGVVVFVELCAVVVSAIYGILLAARCRLDAVGAFAVAFLAAFGGGTLRDLFLDRQPLFWIKNPHYPLIVLLLAVGAGFFVRYLPRLRSFLLVPDAVGMGLFTSVGPALALQQGTSLFIAALLGTITGTFGGVLADIACNRLPTLFQPAPLCATCSFAGAWVYLGAVEAGLDADTSLFAGSAAVVVFRLAAVRWNWTLPAMRGETRDPGPPSP